MCQTEAWDNVNKQLSEYYIKKERKVVQTRPERSFTAAPLYISTARITTHH